MITDSIKAYIAGVVAVLLLLVLIPTGIHNFALQAEVEQLETDKTTLKAEALIKRMEVQGLVDAIGDQEKKIKEFEATAQQMAEARLKAQQQAAQRIEQLNNRIVWLEQDKGASCTAAGIGKTILDEVLP
jgi:TolA-binding protein